jgi:hypothetical protein
MRSSCFQKKARSIAVGGLNVRNWALLLLALGLVACQRTPSHKMASDKPTFAVLPLAAVRQQWDDSLPLCDSHDTVGITPSWTIPQDVAERVDSLIRKRLAGALQRAGDDRLRSADYLLQYVGVTHEGRKAIFVNGIQEGLAREHDVAGRTDVLAKAIRNHWQKQLLFVCDAGRLEFTAVVGEDGFILRPVRFFQALAGSVGPDPMR